MENHVRTASLDAWPRVLAAAPGRRLDVVEGRGSEGYWRRTDAARRAEYSAWPAAPQVIFGGYDRRVRPTLIVLGLLLVGAGLVWMAQGLNLPFAPRSFMTADRSWIVIGAATVMAGAVVVVRARRRA